MTFVRVRLALDRLSTGDVLLVTLSGDEPRRNVGPAAELQGHAVLDRIDDPDGTTRLWISKGPPLTRR